MEILLFIASMTLFIATPAIALGMAAILVRN